MYKKILVPIDGSATAAGGLKAAIDLARERDAQLLLLHVVDQRAPVLNAAMGPWIASVIADLKDEGKALLARAEAQAGKAGVRCRGVLVETFDKPVADIIVAQARRLGAQLIVLGTHGRRGFSRLVMGSDAEGVVRGAHVPVMLVRNRRVGAKKAGTKQAGTKKASKGSKARLRND